MTRLSSMTIRCWLAAAGLAVSGAAHAAEAAGASGDLPRNAYFGDLHVHTMLSFDAYIFGTRTTPGDAYTYARGAPLTHPAGFTMQLDRPLDFLGVTDHGIYMGMLRAMEQPDSPVGSHPLSREIREATSAESRQQAFQRLRAYVNGNAEQDDLFDPVVLRSAWEETVAAAERYNEPGRFTTFVAYEYSTSGDARENLHRNVVFRGPAPAQPFTIRDSRDPEDLWVWMDQQRAAGVESLAIPHNSNGSDGLMFAPTRFDGSAMDADYAERRMRNEPLVEVTQVKGTSETHPLLSPNDEWASFELMQVKVGTVQPSRANGSYVREAYRSGLSMSATSGFNPFRFGLIGSSDTHVAAAGYDESNYWSKAGMLDATPALRGSVPVGTGEDGEPTYAGSGAANLQNWGASGLAGVWAEANTRDALYSAFRRKETFATSGPRMRVRLFAGYDLRQTLAEADRVAALYRDAVPMGGDLLGRGKTAPEFYVWAVRDPRSAPLQRLQIVKGWVTEDAQTQEQVYDVACSDGLAVDPSTHRCPDNGAAVDLSSCAIREDSGAAELAAVWRDPDFEAGQQAFYYARVLENPTCRWSTWDALRAGVAPRSGLAPTIQERAWSSPIWYAPRADGGRS
ncbi:MAG: DUF3604 domain-containing protein [Pseudomonadales bacterium]